MRVFNSTCARVLVRRIGQVKCQYLCENPFYFFFSKNINTSISQDSRTASIKAPHMLVFRSYFPMSSSSPCSYLPHSSFPAPFLFPSFTFSSSSPSSTPASTSSAHSLRYYFYEIDNNGRLFLGNFTTTKYKNQL